MAVAKDADACARALWRATPADISSAEAEALRQERDYLRACLQELQEEGARRTEGQASSPPEGPPAGGPTTEQGMMD